ncbi:hypothetical protein AURDEDRAFT_74418 [Auricularia subglabra TFB-10046 SS5]|nr:hypothetical protein AURDEDRAFT_74418 [Auricularia subglabra TFB-10046 SS5]
MRSAARDESPAVRYAYLSAAVNRTFRGQTYRQAEQGLRDMLGLIDMMGGLPAEPAPATTLVSAMRRLRLDPDESIIRYAACPICWRMFSPTEFTELGSPMCPERACAGRIYTEKRNSTQRLVRTPCKIVPYVSIVESLRRMMLRPGFADKIRDSRNDDPGLYDDPDFVKEGMHHGLIWHTVRTRTRRMFDATGNFYDVPVNEDGQQPPLTSHRFGLHLTITMDWFPLTDGRPHSAGPIYVLINDLPASEFLLPHNALCIMITPGPKEPTPEQINHLFKPILEEVHELHQGVKMHKHRKNAPPEPIEVYGDIVCGCCDSQARFKMFGGAGPSHNKAFCAWCKCTAEQINSADGYTENAIPMTDDRSMLKLAWQWLAATTVAAAALFKSLGIRWMIMNLLAGWFPRRKQGLDFMHCIYLGLVKHYFDVIFKAYLISNAGGDRSPAVRMQRTLNGIMWPSHVGRLPGNLVDNHSLKKADQYRRLLTVSPILLWEAWKDENDEIAESPPALPSRHKYTGQPDRQPRIFYNAGLTLAVAARFLAAHKIALTRARRAVGLLRSYALALLSIGVHLMPNHHWSTHFDDIVEGFGPIPCTWLFGSERFNGLLEKVGLNGRTGGRMELTLMRHWVRTHLFYEYIIDLPPDVTEQERSLLERTLRDDSQQRGSLLTQIAIARDEDENGSLSVWSNLVT